jgi:hypothetical protein
MHPRERKMTYSLDPEGAELPASSGTFGFSTALNSTQSTPHTLPVNPISTLWSTWYRWLTCIPDPAGLTANGCTDMVIDADI